jgi:hypothetical protein
MRSKLMTRSSRLEASSPKRPSSAAGDSGSASIYFHYPCFDGLVSAVIAMDFLAHTRGWQFDTFFPVNYDQKGRWHELPLSERSAVVDFLYHPAAAFWADHHPTTFLTDCDYQGFLADQQSSDRCLLYDRGATSCAALMFATLHQGLTDEARYAEMAQWADKIDSANYASVEEAVYGENPAIEINLSLSIDAGNQQYAELLLQSMRTMPLTEVRNLRDVQRRIRVARRRMRSGLSSVERSIHLVDGEIAVFSARESKGVAINRYSPYIFYPGAAYSVGLVRSRDASKITAMRNPWRHFQGKALGEIFRKFGGGGHERVASVIIARQDDKNPQDVLDAIVAELRNNSPTSIAV